MRAAPAVQVHVTRFGLWRAAVVAVVALVWLIMAGWCVSQVRAAGGVPAAPVVGAGVAAVVAASWLAAGLLRVRPFHLRWDGRCWQLAAVPAGPGAADPVAGDVVAQVDLGNWLLLRFVPERPTPDAVPRWLPLQRRGLEPSWHALRCAVHSPKPGAPPAAPVAQ